MYTYLMQFRGGTYIRQVEAETLEESLRLWATNLDYSEIAFFGESSKQELVNLLPELTPVPIDSVNNVWLVHELLHGGSIFVHVIKTEIS